MEACARGLALSAGGFCPRVSSAAPAQAMSFVTNAASVIIASTGRGIANVKLQKVCRHVSQTWRKPQRRVATASMTSSCQSSAKSAGKGEFTVTRRDVDPATEKTISAKSGSGAPGTQADMRVSNKSIERPTLKRPVLLSSTGKKRIPSTKSIGAQGVVPTQSSARFFARTIYATRRGSLRRLGMASLPSKCGTSRGGLATTAESQQSRLITSCPSEMAARIPLRMLYPHVGRVMLESGCARPNNGGR